MEVFQALNDYALHTTPAFGLEILWSSSKESVGEDDSFAGVKESLALLFLIFLCRP